MPVTPTSVEVFVDPSCPWAWITSRWVSEVAPDRELALTWRSLCIEIRDDYGVAATVPHDRREVALAAHALSHRMLRVFEAVRAAEGEPPIGELYTEWGRRFFDPGRDRLDTSDTVIADALAACRLDGGLLAAADDDRWDRPIVESMEVAYAFGGHKTQTPVIVVRTDPPVGWKGPVMAAVPSGDDAVRLWDALLVLAHNPNLFEMTRPRARRPILPRL